MMAPGPAVILSHHGRKFFQHLPRLVSRASRMVLAGLAVSFLFLSLTYYLIFAGDQRAAHSVLFWTPGAVTATGAAGFADP